jgi:hypothetical protein
VPSTSSAWRELEDQLDLAGTSAPEGVEVRRVQPSQARKGYLCPGCQQPIPPGTSHVVVVPVGDTDSRRHWHTSCWMMRERRRPGR